MFSFMTAFGCLVSLFLLGATFRQIRKPTPILPSGPRDTGDTVASIALMLLAVGVLLHGHVSIACYWAGGSRTAARAERQREPPAAEEVAADTFKHAVGLAVSAPSASNV